MRTLPLDARADVARNLILAGEDPHMMLAAAVWPNHVSLFVEVPTPSEGFCKNGHPWNEENTYLRPNRPGWKKCRACDREQRNAEKRKQAKKRNRRKEPCAYCGEPATAAGDKGTGGLATPRCRRCFMAQLKAGLLRR